MSDYDRAPLLKEAFQSYVKERDPILAAPRKSTWELIKEAARRAWNEPEEMTFKEAWRYSWQTAALHGFRRVKAAIYQYEFIKPLKAGEKKSVGHIVPRHETSEFASIDRSIWHEARIDIQKSKVAADDVSFASVRILENEPAPAEGPAPRSQGPDAGAPSALPVSKSRGGRPSIKHLVSAACEQLWADESFSGLTRKLQAKRVREVIKVSTPTERALYEKTKDNTLEGLISAFEHEKLGNRKT